MGLWEYLRNKKEKRLHEDRYILCLDGGGMRGVIPATMLMQLEHTLHELGDARPLYAHFDLIAGTSTGGLLALALTSPSFEGSMLPIAKNPSLLQPMPGVSPGVDLSSIRDVYLSQGSVIFPRNQSFLQLHVIGQLFAQKYDDVPFTRLLWNLFGGLLMRDALVPTMVVTYDCAKDRPFIIGSYNKGTIPMRLAARATSAAPTYFSPLTLTEGTDGERVTLIDGGVVANNPVLYAYMEAKRLYPDAKRFHVLSLSTASAPYMLEADKTNPGVIGWLDPAKGAPIYQVYASSQMRTSHEIASVISDLEYVRIHGGIGREVKLDETSPAVLKEMTDSAMRIYAQHHVQTHLFLSQLARRPLSSALKIQGTQPGKHLLGTSAHRSEPHPTPYPDTAVKHKDGLQ